MTQMTTCTNCSGPVAIRRPSSSGAHYCTAKRCQAAKQRFYRDRRANTAELEAQPLRLALITDLINVPRVPCEKCGLTDALPGWVHRDATGLTPCFGVGSQGKGLGPGYLDAVHPDRVPAATS